MPKELSRQGVFGSGGRSSLVDRLLPSRRSNPFDNPNYGMTEVNVNAFLESLNHNRSDSGENVTPDTAMQTSIVWACIKLISEQIATNPLYLYQLDGKGNKNMAVNHDYFDLITHTPNDEQDSIQFRTAVQTNLLLHGNGYVEIQRDKGGRVVAMWNRSAARTKPYRLQNGRLVYITTDGTSSERQIELADMIHIMGNTFNGYIGLSPIAYARQAIGGNIAMDKFSGRFFANFAMPQLALLTKKLVKPEVKQQMRNDWEAMHSGINQHRLAVIDGEAEIKTLSVPPEDAQFLETKMATKRDIATMFGVPLQKLNDFEKGVKATSEQQDTDFYNVCLKPWMAKWEKGLTNKLFSKVGRSAGRFVVRYDIRDLIRPDASSRQSYYQSMIQNGVLSQNEVREIEGFNSIGPDGDGHYIQLNMQSLAQANSTDPTPDEPNTELNLEVQENSIASKAEKAYRHLFDSGMQRLMKRPTRDYRAVMQCMEPALSSMAVMLRESNVPLVADDPMHKAVAKTLERIEHVAGKWDGQAKIESLSKEELRKAVKSLVFAAQRERADTIAKKHIEELEPIED